MTKKKRKKKKTLLEIYKTIRKVWKFNPKTKIVDKDKKKRKRAQLKREFRRRINEEE